MKVIFYASQLLLCINLIFYKCQSSTKLCRLMYPVACSFLTILLFFTSLCLTLHSLSCPSSALLLFLHTAFFSLIALHLFLYPPTQHTDTAEGISLSHTVSLIALILLSICLSPYLPPSVSIFTSLPHSPSFPPSLSSSSLAISPCTLDSFYTLRKHPSFCSVEEKSLLFSPFSFKKKKKNPQQYFPLLFFTAVFSFPTPTLSCGSNPKAGTNMFYFQLVIMAGTVLLAYYFEYTDTFPVHIQGFFCFDKAYSKPYPGPEENSKAPPVLVYSLATAIPTVTVSLFST